VRKRPKPDADPLDDEASAEGEESEEEDPPSDTGDKSDDGGGGGGGGGSGASSTSSSSSDSSDSDPPDDEVEVDPPEDFGDGPGPHAPPPLPAELVAPVFGGSITYYSGERDSFVARCGTHGSQCRRERKAFAGRRPSQGRPLGYLLQYLYDTDNHATKKAHTDSVFAHDLRLLRRQEFMHAALANPIFQMMLAAERDQIALEGIEPEQQP
jgi:hypothetical protein